MGPPFYCIVLLCTILHTAARDLIPLERLVINGDDIVNQLKTLATFSDDPNPAVTRILFTENDIKAREYVKKLMKDAGLQVTQDSMGSIFGTLNPTSTHSSPAPAIATGSHCDAIPLAGAYDGTVGVIGGIAALQALIKAGYTPLAAPLQVIFFTSEEPTRFKLSCLGSRAMAGMLTSKDLGALRDENGTTFLQAAKAANAGGVDDEGKILDAALLKGKNKIGAFIELHIEQAPELETSGIPIGVVTAIAAPSALRIAFHGDGGHAGAHLMHLRNDASLAAAELALQVEAAALSTGTMDTVATTGRWEVSPNAVNSVPRDAVLEIDVRDVEGDRRDRVVDTIQVAAKAIASKRNVTVVIDVVSSDPPATSAPEVIDAIEESVKELGIESQRMVSRAYHDTLFMAQIAPSGMVFIPCEGGKSHRPDEYASAEDIERGVRVLAGAMARLGDGTFIKTYDKDEL